MMLPVSHARVSLLLAFALAAPVSAQQLIGYVNTRDANVTGATDVLDGHVVLTGSVGVTAKDHTAPITLSRGGTVNVCQTSVVHLTESREMTVAAPLLFSLDHGAVEIQMTAAASDSIMTPDLRFTVRNAGPLDLRLRVARNGDTCVENRGPGAPTLAVSDPFGESMYEVPAGRHVLFEHGSLHEVVDHETTPCGCPDEKGMSVADALLSQPSAAPKPAPPDTPPQPTIVAPPLEQLPAQLPAPPAAVIVQAPAAAPAVTPPAVQPPAAVPPPVAHIPAPVVTPPASVAAQTPVVVVAPPAAAPPAAQPAVSAPAPKPAPPALVAPPAAVIIQPPAPAPAPKPAPPAPAPAASTAPPAAVIVQAPAPVVPPAAVMAAPPSPEPPAPSEKSVEQAAAVAAARAAALHPFPAAISEGLAPVPEAAPAPATDAHAQISDSLSYSAAADVPASAPNSNAAAPTPAAGGKQASTAQSSATGQPTVDSTQSSTAAPPPHDLVHLIGNFFRKLFGRG
jgi:hypothetical protein